MKTLAGRAIGVATASIDWCEANFIYTRYIAELYNTVSNSFMIFIGLFGVYKALQQRLPKRILLSYLSLSIIGIGSAMFHATLQYSWQLGDELPMIYTSTLMAWLVFDLTPLGQKTPWIPPFCVLVFNVAFTLMYLFYPNPVLHQVAYGILVVAMTFRGAYLILYKMPDKALARQVKHLQAWGSASFGSFRFRDLERRQPLCDSTWAPLKKRVGAPWNVLLEGHSWWHIFTGLGAYSIIGALTMVTLSLRDDAKHYRLRFKYGCLVWVSRTPKGWEALEKGMKGAERSRLLRNGRSEE
ncbi:BQ2448_974 [Microbotryum intermedium]|uniref:BQ2448_974 protein n=1 Tax=Microbotryum intermedium TaxID=269621 RepID=A0A238FA21_9BASI|nr:BQ2448_974 [Microbotryum intermedium]